MFGFTILISILILTQDHTFLHSLDRSSLVYLSTSVLLRIGVGRSVGADLDGAVADLVLVHDGHGALGVPLVDEADEAGAPLLHLGVLDLPAVAKSLPQSLPCAVLGQVAHNDGIRGSQGARAARAPSSRRT